MAHDQQTDTRSLIENEIERLIGLLDAMEPDDGLEEDGSLEGDKADNEPSLGATEYWRSNGGWTNAPAALSEHEVDIEHDDADNEQDFDDEEPTHPTEWAIQFIDKNCEVRL
jgi:hypothetical protein